MAGGIVGWLRTHDPDGSARHKAVKVAVAVTAGVAVGTLLGNPQLSLFASFGGVALLLFADFPGTRSARLGSYLGLFLVGLVLIAVGTLLSTAAWPAVAGMLLVGFLVLFSGVLSAALAGAGRAALLTFILPVTVPAPMGEIPSRWAGWTLAAALSIPLAVFLWPPRDHARLRRAAGTACVALADRLAAWTAVADGPALEQVREQAARAVADLRTQFRRTAVRPVGLTTGSRQLMRLPDRLEWLHTVIDRLPATSARTPGQIEVTGHCVEALRAAAQVLAQAPRRPSFATRYELSVRLRPLQQLRVAGHTFGRLVDSASSTDPNVHPSKMLEFVYTTRLAGLTVAAAAAADARPLADRLLGQHRTATAGPMLPVHNVLAGHLTLHSVWFQNSVRGAFGLTIAVAIAEVTDVQHGFWVVLGTMSVLRTTALTTGSTALRALSGTVIGFAVGSVVMLLVGTTGWHLWLILPITLLIAAYLPEAVSFTAGQAAFTVLVVVLFNIISPTGWQVGLIRVEDVLLGCASALISGMLLWPRGAAPAIRHALGEFYRRAADALVASADRVVGAIDDEDADDQAADDVVGAATIDAAVASLRFDDALREYLFERGTRNVPLDALTRLSDGAGRVRMTAEALTDLPASVDPVPTTAHAIAASADRSRDWFGQLADRLDELPGRRTGEAGPLPEPPEPAAERVVIADTRRALTGAPTGTPSERAARIEHDRNLWVEDLYLDNLNWVQRRLAEPADELTGRATAAADDHVRSGSRA